MKRIIFVILVLAGSLSAHAQEVSFGQGLALNMEAFRIIATIVVLVLIMTFILNMFKKIFDYRLKNKIVDRGIPQEATASILRTEQVDNKNAPVKWFALLAGLGLGLTIVNYTLPLGIHSLAIMSFSLAFSFLGYFVFLKRSAK